MHFDSLWDTFKAIFSGSGGTVRMAISGIGILGFVGAVVESKYQVEGNTSNGDRFFIKPVSEKDDDDLENCTYPEASGNNIQDAQ